MKKTYQKPVLMYESFELSTSIAAVCALKSNAAWMSCPVLIPEWGIEVFIEPGICTYYAPDAKDKVCYHTLTDDNSVFTS